jgi:hypothetical protein
MTIRDKALWGLRLYGPIGNAELARHLGVRAKQLHDAIFALRKQGFASKGRDGCNITPAGRDELKNRPAPGAMRPEVQQYLWSEPGNGGGK